MIYRKLTSTGDYTFGQGASNFYVNDAQAVAQAVKTRLALWEGEWFLDTTEGTPYFQQILGAGHVSTYDTAIQSVVLGTQGVVGITDYASAYDPSTRKVSVSMTISTIYGPIPISIPG